ncbi:HET-domain-containing protein [Annulohypoxylon maeteangense]|uniref:HET-domain-containing protein n=1 Tax=Annulohypoxylon maeteangense TaxID=1927788 RepID=UPI0020088271|nr:HET-domain-containing protein [Annulohypoxylon maeteangense]KAI0886325.1 HET-domain-containing protein [Annulohypoxylon maeteangense]
MSDNLDRILNRDGHFKHPIINSQTQARLMRLSPNRTKNRRLQYRLEVFDLSSFSSIEYTALSYTWGRAVSVDELYEILIDDQPFFVRRNLYNFLATAAGKETSGLFFVDAICINQLNSAERQHQVQQMTRIYRNANNVISWLGVPETVQDLDSVRILAQTRGRWDGFQYISYHPYWSRVWILQEVLLAQRVEVWCWYFTFPLDLFAGIDSSKVNYHISQVRLSSDGRPQTVVDAISRSCSPAERIITHRTRHVFRPIVDPLAQGTAVGTLEEMIKALAYPYMATETYQSSIPDLIHQVVRKFGMLQCSDPRDKLYGFLGILKDNSRAKVNPDYTMPISYAFRQALKIGLEEIGGEHWFGLYSTSRNQVYTILLTYYCDVRDAFDMEDSNSMAILEEVVAELRSEALTTEPMAEELWREWFRPHWEYALSFSAFQRLAGV